MEKGGKKKTTGKRSCNDWKNIQSCAENIRVLVVAVVTRYYRDHLFLVKHNRVIHRLNLVNGMDV